MRRERPPFADRTTNGEGEGSAESENTLPVSCGTRSREMAARLPSAQVLGCTSSVQTSIY